MSPGFVMAGAAESFRARALYGDLSGAESLVEAFAEDGSPAARAWSCAVRTQVWLAFPDAVTLPAAAELEAFVTADPAARRPASRAARDLGLAALLALDARALEDAASLLGRLACDDAGAVDVELARGFAALLAGRPAPAGIEQVGARAGKAGLAAAVVEAQALRALFALEAGDAAAGLELARRSAMMARTEGMPQAEFLANLVLARARRYNRQGHLALRIIDALRRVATPPWQTWVAWESALASGDDDGAAADTETAAGAPARLLGELLDAATGGDAAGFERCWQALQGQLGPGLFAREAADLVAALSPRHEAASDTVRAWRRGDEELVHPALHALALALEAEGDGGDAESAAAYVLVQPGGAGVRFLHRALPLVLGSGVDVARVRQARRTHGRVETVLAILALAGPDGLDEATCFGRAYGFAHVPEIHGGVFDVLVHRARAAVGEAARLERHDRRIALAAARPLLIPDPRMSRHMTDRVLRLLAQQGRASAKEAASKLNVSLRAVQGALAELAQSQACVIERDGRRVTYAVEDTVFSETTLRLRAAGLAHGAPGGAGAPSRWTGAPGAGARDARA